MNTYNRLPVAFTKGQGAWLWDTEGKQYLDALTGIAVCGLGHAHPAISAAISQQAAQLLHTSNLYEIPLQTQLAKALTDLSGMDNVFFANSGAEAVEAALKIARAYGHQQNIAEPMVVVMENSFHGRTMATLTATGNPLVHAGFEPLLSGFIRIPYNDITQLQALTSRTDIVAVLLEPIQGEAGINIPSIDYLPQIRKICDNNQWLMMLDEIQTGMGRTGQWFAHQHSHVTPDVMTLAKGLGNGVPIGACLAHGRAAHVFQPGNHGSTFGGNPLACSAALAVIDTIKQHQLLQRANILGQQILTRLREHLSEWPSIQIRGHGLMIAIELDKPCPNLVKQALNDQLLINVTAQKVIRLLPPLILTDDEATLLTTKLSALIQQHMQSDQP